MKQRPATLMPLVNLLGLGLAAWLLVSRNVLAYPASDPRSDAALNEVLATIVLGVTAASRLILRDGLPKMSALQILAGTWLMTAPSAVGYGEEIPAAGTNALLSGAAMIALGLVAVGEWGRQRAARIAPDLEREAARR